MVEQYQLRTPIDLPIAVSRLVGPTIADGALSLLRAHRSGSWKTIVTATATLSRQTWVGRRDHS
jgi:hypothetical protein